ncbi:MAG: hypothetical protein ACLQLH_12930 [Terracidiphilus sp.]
MDTHEKQFENVMAFANSIGRCTVRWPHKKMKAPLEYLSWKLQRSHVERLSLFLDAGLADEPLFEGRAMFEELLRNAQIAERTAWAAWMRRKERLEMDLLTGKLKTLPWGC